MRYKVGDKVILKRGYSWHQSTYDAYDKLPNNVATIKRISSDKTHYFMKEISWGWQEYEIEGLFSEPEIEIETTRFELMEL